MSDKNTPQDPNLDFDKAKGMTIEEAMDKTSELEAGITEQDSVLDRYIKQHRDEVGSQKFVQRLSELDEIDTATLDEFIKKQREELEKTGFLDKAALVEATEAVDLPTEEEPQMDTIPVVPLVSTESPVTEEQATIYTGDESVEKSSKGKKVALVSLVALLLGVSAVGLGWIYLKNRQSTATKTETTTTTTTTTLSKAATEDVTAFDTLYASFFADEDKTQLKNSEFENLSQLKEALNKLKNTDAYKDAKSKYDSLKRQIEAIKAVNANFETDAIVDGQVQAATVKSDANFDSLSSDVLNTGNAKVDSLIQSVISDGRSQLTDGTAAGSVSGASATVPATQDTSANLNPNATDAKASGTSGAVYATNYGITNYDPATLQRSLSRVPYSEANLADANNEAWNFTPGVLEHIIEVSNQRGYFSGNNFILERVAIINGNGYYNMFKADGTYLFSINAKTGYFVGNAAGHSDALDF